MDATAEMLEVPWAVLSVREQPARFECERCGDTEEAPLGLLAVQFADICRGFAIRHAECEASP